MANLKCTKCEATFEKRTIFARGGALGWGGFALGGFGLLWLIWPLVTKVYAKCPRCGKVTWLEVLQPAKSGSK